MERMNSKIGIYIPCYNVEKTIDRVLYGFSPAIMGKISEIVCVDNCSQDKTLAILRKIKAEDPLFKAKLTILHNKENYGLGGSQKIAYTYFLDRGFTFFMIVHGDAQGDGNDIASRFFAVLDQDPLVDVIFASRFLDLKYIKQYSLLRTFGNFVFNFLTVCLTGCRLSDTGTGIVFIRTSALAKVPFHFLTNSFQFNPQLAILFSQVAGIRIREVPLLWQDSIAKSNIVPLKYCWTLLKILVMYRINKTFRRKSGWQAFYAHPQTIQPSFTTF